MDHRRDYRLPGAATTGPAHDLLRHTSSVPGDSSLPPLPRRRGAVRPRRNAELAVRPLGREGPPSRTVPSDRQLSRRQSERPSTGPAPCPQRCPLHSSQHLPRRFHLVCYSSHLRGCLSSGRLRTRVIRRSGLPKLPIIEMWCRRCSADVIYSEPCFFLLFHGLCLISIVRRLVSVFHRQQQNVSSLFNTYFLLSFHLLCSTYLVLLSS